MELRHPRDRSYILCSLEGCETPPVASIDLQAGMSGSKQRACRDHVGEVAQLLFAEVVEDHRWTLERIAG